MVAARSMLEQFLGHDEASQLIRDTLQTARLVAQRSWRRTIDAWILVPLGVAAVLAVCFGVDRLISLSSVSFPASVACMIILFIGLVLSSTVLGDRTTKKIVSYIDIPCGWALRYINVFLCPGFVVLPLSPSIGGVEVGKIIAVAIVGWAVVFVVTAYFVRGLLLILGGSKRAIVTRAEEMGSERDGIPLSTPRISMDSERPSDDGERTPDETPMSSTPFLSQMPAMPSRSQDPDEITGTGGPPQSALLTESLGPTSILRHDTPPQTRPERWAAFITARLDILTYSAILILFGVPAYYGGNYSMPIQLSLNVLTYQLASSLPPKYKTYLHPILVSSGTTILGIWLLSLIHAQTLSTGLLAYSTGTKYTKLWSSNNTTHTFPGAGDILSSIIDVSIISLALPMFQYRHELRKNALIILLPNTILSLTSLFAYPPLCHNLLGITKPNSLAFASRTLTLALSQISTQNLGGNKNVGTPLAIFSGIFGVLIGNWILKKLKIPEEDYITRGVTLGANSSSLATAMLLNSDPRAAAFSSLSMGLFGTVVVAATSVPVVVQAVRGLVGL